MITFLYTYYVYSFKQRLYYVIKSNIKHIIQKSKRRKNNTDGIYDMCMSVITFLFHNRHSSWYHKTFLNKSIKKESNYKHGNALIFNNWTTIGGQHGK